MQDLNLKAFFSAVTLARARKIIGRNRVVIDHDDIEVDGYLFGRVSGTASFPYTVEVYLDDEYVSSTCSCPVGINCKHGAALTLTWLDSQSPSSNSLSSVASHRRREQLATAVDNDNNVLQWVDNLVSALAPALSRPVSGVPSMDHAIHLMYALRPVEGPTGPTLAVNVLKRTRLKNDEWGKTSPYSLQTFYEYHDSEVSHEDDAVLEILLAAMKRNGYILSLIHI